MEFINLLAQNHEVKKEGKEKKEKRKIIIYNSFWLNSFTLSYSLVFKFENQGKEQVRIHVKWVYCSLLRNNFPVSIYFNLRKINWSKKNTRCSPKHFTKFNFKILKKKKKVQNFEGLLIQFPNPSQLKIFEPPQQNHPSQMWDL